MQFENTMTFVRAIKGAPASVLWALMLTQSMMTSLELQQWTGYKGDNITVAVRLLVDLGWVVARTPRGPWGLAEGRQLPLMSGIAQLEGFEKTDSDLIGVSAVVVVDADSKNALSSDSTTTTTTKRATPIKSESWTDDERANFAALKAAGILGRKARQLAVLPWVTVEYIEAHAEMVKHEFWDNPTGMMIHRMTDEMPAENVRLRKAAAVKLKPNMNDWLGCSSGDDDLPHAEDCNCIDCKRLHPENFCDWRISLPSTFRDRDLKSGPCSARVVPGHRYCVNHLEYESEEE